MGCNACYRSWQTQLLLNLGTKVANIYGFFVYLQMNLRKNVSYNEFGKAGPVTIRYGGRIAHEQKRETSAQGFLVVRPGLPTSPPRPDPM